MLSLFTVFFDLGSPDTIYAQITAWSSPLYEAFAPFMWAVIGIALPIILIGVILSWVRGHH